MNISKVSIIDSNNFYALGIKYVLQSLESCKGSEINIYSTGAEYLSSNQNSDLVLLNMMLPDIGGIKLCHLIKTKAPKTKVILLSMNDDESDLYNCLTSNANGFLIKDFKDKELDFAIYKVFNDSYYIDSNLALRLIKNSPTNKKLEANSLNDFELTLLQYISDQLTDMDIVDKLKMPRGKLSYYKRKLYKKLDVKNSAGLIKKAVSLKLVS